MIGKHFKVRAFNNMSVDAITCKSKFQLDYKRPDVNRHYTICNVMRRSFYEPLVDCLSTGNSRDLISDVLKSQDNDVCSFTVKNYKQPFGVSMKFYEERIDQMFEVSGPFGKGLQVQSEGVHIAFATGTGVLTFMDLVS